MRWQPFFISHAVVDPINQLATAVSERDSVTQSHAAKAEVSACALNLPSVLDSQLTPTADFDNIPGNLILNSVKNQLRISDHLQSWGYEVGL